MRYLSLLILLLTTQFASAQIMEGLVLENDTKEPIQGVNVINKRSKEVVVSDVSGKYSIHTATGDTISFTHTSFKTVTEVIPFSIGNRHKTILMEYAEHRLKETTVTGMTKYQEDSLNTREEYIQPMRQQPGETHMYYGTGIVAEGVISRWVGNLTGYNQRQKRFKKSLITDEQNKFIETRYTIKLVTELTGLQGDSAAHFMNIYPMPYDFARAASDLEIKGWIRYNYKDYIRKTNRE